MDVYYNAMTRTINDLLEHMNNCTDCDEYIDNPRYINDRPQLCPKAMEIMSNGHTDASILNVLQGK